MRASLNPYLLSLYCQRVLALKIPQPTQHIVADNAAQYSYPTVRRTTLPPVSASPIPTPTPHLELRNVALNYNETLNFRAVTTEWLTCGYADGDANRPITASEGYECRVDITHGLWGFCPTSVTSAKDCGFAGVCVDNFDCSSGCGTLRGSTGITTFTCGTDTASAQKFCSTLLLDSGVDQTYSYIACGTTAKIEMLLTSPTTEMFTVEPTTILTSIDSGTTSALSATPSKSSISSQPSSTTLSAPATTVTDLSTASLQTAYSSTSSAVSPLSTASGTASASVSATTAENTGAIIGGVIGGIALVCITVCAVVYLLRRNARRRHESQEIHTASNTEVGAPASRDYEDKTSWAPAYSLAELEQNEQQYPAELYAYTNERHREPAELY